MQYWTQNTKSGEVRLYHCKATALRHAALHARKHKAVIKVYAGQQLLKEIKP